MERKEKRKLRNRKRDGDKEIGRERKRGREIKDERDKSYFLGIYFTKNGVPFIGIPRTPHT